jgi:PAS domain S-box-containing protein
MDDDEAQTQTQILLVEDDEVDRMAVHRLVRRAGLPWTLIDAGTLAEARRRLAHGGLDLLLIDHRLPDGTGLEVQRLAGELPCVFLSGSTDVETSVEAMRAGALDFVVKDAEGRYVSLLPMVVQGALARHEAARELESYREGLERLVQQRTAQLESAMQFTAAAVDALSDTLFVFDPEDQKALYWNAAMREVSGYTDEELATQPAPRTYYDADDLARAAAATRRVLDEGRGSVELELICKDGRRVPFEYRATIVRGPGGEHPCFAVIGRDISERRRLQASLSQSDRLASVGLLAAGVAHEINNPLAYLLFNLQSLRTDLPLLAEALTRLQLEVGPQRIKAVLGDAAALVEAGRLADLRQQADDALNGAERVRKIVRDLKTFSRADEERLVPVSLNEVLESAVSMAFNEIKYRARLVREYGQLPTLLANDSKLAQVFLNLLINAAQAIDEGDTEGNEIRLRTSCTDGEVRVEVRDTGCGIEADLLPRLFDPFVTTKDVGVGSGLGLSICRNIVSEHGGVIEVQSSPGQGSSFAVRLPLAPTDHNGRVRPMSVETQASVGPVAGRILVVDDEPRVCAILKRLLTDSGHEVQTAASGSEALELLDRDSGFDAILCDLMMPEVTGMDLYARLEERDPALAGRMVFVTGGGFTPRARAFLDGSHNAVLDKPFDRAKVALVLAELLGTKA